MQDITVNALQAIQALLAPAVGISAVGLLMLGLGSQYSSIINRIRLLNDEKRRFKRQLADGANLSYADNARFMSIGKQSEELLVRSRFVRNGILSMQLAVALFVLTSAGIGLNLFFSTDAFKIMPLIIFICGMLCVFMGITFAAIDIYRSFTVILLEVQAEE
jgi:hypothetical protein